MAKNKHTTYTQSQSHFAKSVHADVPRSTFYRNNTVKTAFNAGDLVPVYVDEVYPADTYEMDMRYLVRMATPMFPTMDIAHLEFFAFFVPNRIVWSSWEQLMGENTQSAWTPQNDPAPVPRCGVQPGNNFFDLLVGSIGDYYGLPINDESLSFINMAGRYSLENVDLTDPNFGNSPSALPFRGYQKIWNDWFRDQNYQAPIPIDLGDSNINYDDRFHPRQEPLKVNKKHDYFTSCLPSPQKGMSSLIPIDISGLIPIICGDDIPLSAAGSADSDYYRSLRWLSTSKDSLGSPVVGSLASNTSGSIFSGTTSTTTAAVPGESTFPSNLWGNVSDAVVNNTTTISDLRTAFQIQKLYERDARGGTRYIEMLKAHFGVQVEDYRLQRPEFLGHLRADIGITQVPQTSATDQNSTLHETPQGHLAAFSQTFGSGTIFKKSFVEHGFIHIFAVVRHPKTYCEGIEKFWLRRDRLDFYHPVLSHISEQPVKLWEIRNNYSYPPYSTINLNSDIGFNEAWADLRYKPNRLCSVFRTNASSNLSAWHYGDFIPDSFRVVDSAFITDNSFENIARTLAISTEPRVTPQFIADLAFICKCTRPLPMFSIPSLVDHF